MKALLASASALMISTLGAFGADLGVVRKAPPVAEVASPWDVAFGAAIMSDYVFRGISQSNRRPSVAAYFEPRYTINSNWQLYAGIAGESIAFPNRAAAEIDFYAGVRPTFGSLALDFGIFYYYYPGGQQFNGDPALNGPLLGIGFPNPSCTNGLFVNAPPAAGAGCNVVKSDVSFYDVYGKATYTFNDYFNVGANVYYSPNFLNFGAAGTFASGTAKFTVPSTWMPTGVGAYLSGEFGRYWLGTTDAFYFNTDLPDYNTWNIGLGLTYKVFTLDIRYYDTDLSRANCNVITGDFTATFSPGDVTALNPSGLGSNWCGDRIVAKLSADLTFANLK
jgi:hypothetical protein